MPQEKQHSQPHAQLSTATAPEHDFDAEHDPARARSVSLALLRGEVARSQVANKQVDDALQPVASPAPKPKSNKHGTRVDTDRAPDVDDVLDPKRPSLDGASHEVVLESIEKLVTDIYDRVFSPHLDLLQTSLGKTRPPPETPFALTLLGWVVEMIASATVSSIGKIAAKEIFGKGPAIEAPKTVPTPVDVAIGKDHVAEAPKRAAPSQTPREAAAGDAATSAGKAAGGALKKEITQPRPTSAPAPGEVPHRAAPGETLLVEFISRQRQKLLGKKHDAVTTLTLIRASAAGKAAGDFVDLDTKLRNLIESAELAGWFEHKVTMEWLNFVARISLGPRAAGQTTDMIGANTIDGIASAGPQARQKWRNAEGFVEITLNTPDHVDGLRGLAVRGATIPSSYGAVLKLRDAEFEMDANGQPYNLATLPVYRRVWLKTGASKLSESPAFVITPDGQIETDVSNPVLAAIGSGAPVEIGEVVHIPGGTGFTDEERKDPAAWSRRAINATQAILGAHLIRELLRGVTPRILQ